MMLRVLLKEKLQPGLETSAKREPDLDKLKLRIRLGFRATRMTARQSEKRSS
jgi:hypothetical protein